MKNKRLAPKRRFKGFINDGAWEKQRLGDLAAFSKGKGYTKSDLIEIGTPIILYGSLYTDYKTVITEIDTFAEDKIDSVYSLGNEVIVPSSGETAEDIVRASVVEKEGVILGGDLNIIHPNNNNDSVFLALSISNGEMQKELIKRAQGKSIVHLHNTDLSEVELFYPSKQEQARIGVFFKKLDNLITLQQGKLQKVKDLKLAYLSEMFPEEGEKYPKIRFAGFTDPWEQRKFNNLLNTDDGIRRGPFGSALKKEYFVLKSDYVVYEQQNAINDHYRTRYYITKEKYEELIHFKVNPGDFIMSGAGTVGCISRIPEDVKMGVFNQALIRIRINDDILDSEFFIQWIRSPNMQRKLTEANPASAMVNLVPISEIKEWEVFIPEKDEQQKIGTFFKKLDNLITLHQRKLEKLENIKKAYLNEMFI